MGLRIHFGSDDFVRTRLAQTPDPMWEVLLSLHMLQTNDGPLVFDQWRRDLRSRLDPAARRLLALAPPSGYSPDFLTPAAGAGGLDLGLSALMSTPRGRLRDDLTRFAVSQGRTAPWMRGIAEGDPEALRGLGEAVQSYYRVALAPHWSRVRAEVGADLAARSRVMTAAGLPSGAFDHLMRTLHPTLEWQSPVLIMHGPHVEGDLHLDGRGLLLLPSFFCWRKPTVLRSHDLPPVVVYPIEHSPLQLAPGRGPGGRDRGSQGLVALLGRTRATLLEAVAEGGTTTELARTADIAAATASHHVSVLREAGLLITRRVGGAALHTLTPLGVQLLNGRRVA
ncbi:helix-turn-helix transcriptional regulator [Streptomyces sp. I05A-00742]|uniref:ArsR/SmtB family transcription factor n=1 Tax=Streptomyces sp. I05A-00742 TaxID=2732853 RepID=UPI001489F155|nr:winged helix-turn-helix domain-containing protein [Streptomyces sp. I05A-00742]